jgi:hypothetical protein
LSSARKKKGKERMEKKKKKVRGNQNIKVMKVRSLNLHLDLLWKDHEVKLWGFIEDYKALLFAKFQTKINVFYKSYELLKILCKI